MTDWQTILAVGIVAAGLTGRQWLVVLVVAGNFIATMELAGNPINVAIADSIAATILLFTGRRGQIVAAIYAVMIPLYPILSASGFANSTIYAIIDGLAIAQLVVAGRWDVGIGRALRLVHRGYADLRRPRAARPELAGRLGVSEAKGERS